LEICEPEVVGLSSARLNRLSSWLQDQVDNERVAGASVLVGRRGKVALSQAVGLADVAIDRLFTTDTVVRMYSMTKAVTSVAAMALYERGCFQLDDPVADYLPEFARTPVWRGGDAGLDDTEPQSTPMTVRHLLTHTSGLTYGFMRANVVDAAYRAADIEFPGSAEDLATLVARVAAVPLLCQPGSQWNYGVSTDVLGRLVEVWSGQALDTFFREEIFKPLGMEETAFHVSADLAPRFAALYAPHSGADMSGVAGVAPGSAKADGSTLQAGFVLQESASDSRFLRPTRLFSGGGGLVGTMADYGRFCQMLLNGGALGDARILGRKTVEYMRLNHLPNNSDMAAMGQPVWSETSYDGIGFGLGFAVVVDPVKAHIITSPGEHHWGGAASTFFWIDPEEDLFVVFLTQLIPSSTYPIRRELRTRVYQALVD